MKPPQSDAAYIDKRIGGRLTQSTFRCLVVTKHVIVITTSLTYEYNALLSFCSSIFRASSSSCSTIRKFVLAENASCSFFEVFWFVLLALG